MRTTGPTQGSLLVSGAGPEQGLRAGAVVSVEVLERVGPELLRVRAAGLVLTARAAGLQPGSLFSARVERSEGGYLLRILPARIDALQSLLHSAALPADRFSRLALAAILREGLAPEATILGRVRRAGAAAEGRSESEAADRRALASRLEAKGIAAEEVLVDALSERGAGYGGGEGDSSRRRREEPRADLPEAGLRHAELSAEEEAPAAAPFNLEEGFTATVNREGLPRLLGSLLAALSMRSGGEGDLLSLFNHLRGPDGSWIHIPFAFDLDAIAFSGSFRVKLPYIGGGPGRIEARFRSSRQDEERHREWLLSVEFGGTGGVRLRIAVDDAGALASARRLAASLAGDLAPYDCSLSIEKLDEDKAPGGLDLDA